MSRDLPNLNRSALVGEAELRAITKKDLTFDNAVMMSSTTPSPKYSCSGSPLMFVKGSTAMEGLSGSGSACWRAGGLKRQARQPLTEQARGGSSMFLIRMLT